jgi:broad specificity phosphatase PhoE
MAELYLIRHGQASFGSDNYDQLSPLGHQQAIWLGEYFHERGIAFDAVITGDMVRHTETADGILKGLQHHNLQNNGAEHQVLPGLNEFDFLSLVALYLNKNPDQLPGKDAPRDTFFKLLKKSMHGWISGEINDTNLETWQHFEQRILNAMQTIQKQYHGQKVLAVSSGGAISMALRQILKAPSETVIELNLQTKNTAVAHCFFNPKTLRMTSYNHTPHLDTNERADKITFS